MLFLVAAHTLSLYYCSLSPDCILCPCDTRYSHIRYLFNILFIYIIQIHHTTTDTVTLLLLLPHCDLCYSLQQFSHFLLLFLCILPLALLPTDCLSNWHPVLNTFFPCLFHFLVLPIRYTLGRVHPSPGYKFCPPPFLLNMWAKCGLIHVKLIYDVLVLCSVHSSNFWMQGRNVTSLTKLLFEECLELYLHFFSTSLRRGD
jgi:hypothetical protein